MLAAASLSLSLARRRRRVLASGGCSLVEHRIPPRSLCAPLHRHDGVDDCSFVLDGRMGALLCDAVICADAGELAFKPRDQWHTFWNAGDESCRILEIIRLPASSTSSAGGTPATSDGTLDPEELRVRYGIRVRYGQRAAALRRARPRPSAARLSRLRSLTASSVEASGPRCRSAGPGPNASASSRAHMTQCPWTSSKRPSARVRSACRPLRTSGWRDLTLRYRTNASIPPVSRGLCRPRTRRVRSARMDRHQPRDAGEEHREVRLVGHPPATCRTRRLDQLRSATATTDRRSRRTSRL